MSNSKTPGADAALTPAQQNVVSKLRDGWTVVWSRDGEAGCYAHKRGSVSRVSPRTLQSLERLGLIRDKGARFVSTYELVQR